MPKNARAAAGQSTGLSEEDFVAACGSEPTIARKLFESEFAAKGYSMDDAVRFVSESIQEALRAGTWKIERNAERDDSMLAPLLINGVDQRKLMGLAIIGPNGRPTIQLRYLRTSRPSNNGISQSLEQFAYLGRDGDLYESLAHLAAMARDERWGDEGSDNPLERYSQLLSYLKYTFQRLNQEGKVAYSDDGTLAAFNTGLVTNEYTDIYAAFSKNHVGRQKWKLDGFCRSDRPRDSIAMYNIEAKLGRSLPRASYFSDISEVFYDAQKPVPDFSRRHIVRERLGRFPVSVIAEAFGVPAEKAVEIKEKALDKSNGDRTDRIERLVPIYAPGKHATDVALELEHRVASALAAAHGRALVNYTIAVPAFFPTSGKMSFMLPLRLQEPDGPVDLVAVIVREDSGMYYAKTVLEPEVARTNWRLVMGPYDLWAVPQQSSDATRSEREKIADERVTTGRMEVSREELREYTSSGGGDAGKVHRDGTTVPVPYAFLTVGATKCVVRNGSLVGVLRYLGKQSPDIRLPGHGFQSASHDHGVFEFNDGHWTFTNHGRNGTRVLRGDKWYVIGADPFELENGDWLEFGNASGLDAAGDTGRVLFEMGGHR